MLTVYQLPKVSMFFGKWEHSIDISRIWEAQKEKLRILVCKPDSRHRSKCVDHRLSSDTEGTFRPER